MDIAPCPICGALYGFHDEEPHNEANARIPAELKRPSNTAVRADRREERRAAYEEYKRSRAEGRDTVESLARALIPGIPR